MFRRFGAHHAQITRHTPGTGCARRAALSDAAAVARPKAGAAVLNAGAQNLLNRLSTQKFFWFCLHSSATSINVQHCYQAAAVPPGWLRNRRVPEIAREPGTQLPGVNRWPIRAQATSVAVGLLRPEPVS